MSLSVGFSRGTGGLTRDAKRPRFDSVIGLDVAGKLSYCRKSTLLNVRSSYFRARFGPGMMMDPEVDRTDSNGREIFFIDRDVSFNCTSIVGNTIPI